jgi:hypothetical protein
MRNFYKNNVWGGKTMYELKITELKKVSGQNILKMAADEAYADYEKIHQFAAEQQLGSRIKKELNELANKYYEEYRELKQILRSIGEE